MTLTLTIWPHEYQTNFLTLQIDFNGEIRSGVCSRLLWLGCILMARLQTINLLCHACFFTTKLKSFYTWES